MGQDQSQVDCTSGLSKLDEQIWKSDRKSEEGWSGYNKGLDWDEYRTEDGMFRLEILVNGEIVNSNANRSVSDYRNQAMDYKEQKNQMIVAEKAQGIFAIDADKLNNETGREAHEKAANYVIRKLKSEGKNMDNPQFYLGASKYWESSSPFLEVKSGTFNTNKQLQSNIKMSHTDNKKPAGIENDRDIPFDVSSALMRKLASEGLIDGHCDDIRAPRLWLRK